MFISINPAGGFSVMMGRGTVMEVEGRKEDNQ
jgi:hypothetical protein